MWYQDTQTFIKAIVEGKEVSFVGAIHGGCSDDVVLSVSGYDASGHLVMPLAFSRYLDINALTIGDAVDAIFDISAKAIMDAVEAFAWHLNVEWDVASVNRDALWDTGLTNLLYAVEASGADDSYALPLWSWRELC